MGPPKKKKSSTSDSVVSTVPEGQCIFCRSSEDNDLKLGKKMSKQGISIHYFCMLFASGLSQRGRGDREGILGFLVPDIVKESRRSDRLRCSYCKKPSATIGCVKANCRASFHFGCGTDAGALNQFYGNFSSFCSEHRPLQVVPEQEKKMYRGKYTSCVICMSKVLALPSVDTLRTSCCKANSWYHRECVQRMAMASGLHFCKCPLCNNKDAFQQEMLDFGIYIPDRDAEWELEPNAFQELLERHNRCDHAECRCPRGRTFNEADTGWEVVLCDWCGHQGTHVNCGRLGSPDQEWVCEECISISNDAESPLLKAKLFGKKTAKSRKKIATLVTAGGSTSARGQKRPNPVSEAQVAEKRKRLSLSGRSSGTPSQSAKENYNARTTMMKSEEISHPGHSKKTADKAKIKSSSGKNNQGQNQPRDLRFYLFHGDVASQSTSHSHLDSSSKTSHGGLSSDAKKAVRTLDKWLRRSSRGTPEPSPTPHPPLAASSMEYDAEVTFKTEIIEENNVKKEYIEESNLTDSSDSSYSSRSRADRARRRASAAADIGPNGLKQRFKDDVFTGSNLGVKFLGLANPTSGHSSDQPQCSDSDTSSRHDSEALMGRMARSRRGSGIKHLDVTREGRPAWFRHLLDDDYLTGRNLGRKLSAASPGIHLSPGMACRLQTTHGSPPDGGVPTGRGNDSSIPSDHPGTVTLGHVSTVHTQEASASETEDSTTVKKGRGRPRKYAVHEPPPVKRQNMKYWEFIQHLEDIGFKHQSTIIDRLSLYQQYLEGEFQLLTCADISLSNATCENGEREAHSPTPSLVSPNDSSWSPQDETGPAAMQQSCLPNQPTSNVDSVLPNSAVADKAIPSPSAKDKAIPAPSAKDKAIPAPSAEDMALPVPSAVEMALQVDTPAVSMPTDTDKSVSSEPQQTESGAPPLVSNEMITNTATGNVSSNMLETESTPVMAQDPTIGTSQSLGPLPEGISESIPAGTEDTSVAPISDTLDHMTSNQSASAEEVSPVNTTATKAADTNSGREDSSTDSGSEDSDDYARAHEMLAAEDLSKAPSLDTNKVENTPMEIEHPPSVTENTSLIDQNPMEFESQSPTHITEGTTENTTPEVVDTMANVDDTCDNSEVSGRSEHIAEITATGGANSAVSDDDDDVLDDDVLDDDDDVLDGDDNVLESDNDDTIAAITALEESLENPQDSNVALQEQTVAVQDSAATMTADEEVMQTDTMCEGEESQTQDITAIDKTTGSQHVPGVATINDRVTDISKETENAVNTSIETESAMDTSIETESAIDTSVDTRNTIDTSVVEEAVQTKTLQTEGHTSLAIVVDLVQVDPGTCSSTPTHTLTSDPSNVEATTPQEPASQKLAITCGTATNAILIEDDPVITIEDVHTVGPTDAVHIDIEEIPTGSTPTPMTQKAQVIKVDEIATGPIEIDLTSDDGDTIMLQPATATRKKECCRHCGKRKKRPLSNLDTNTYYSNSRQVIEID